MTDTRPAPVFGQTVGEAQRALRGILDGVLDDAGVAFDTWVVLNALAIQGPSIPAARLRRDLEYGLQAEPEAISALLDRLQAAGLIRYISDPAAPGSGRFDLTPDAQTLHRRLRQSIASVSARLYAGIDPADLETTVNVLLEVTKRVESSRDRDSIPV